MFAVGCSSSTLSRLSTNATCGSVPSSMPCTKSAKRCAPTCDCVQSSEPLSSEPSLYTPQVTPAWSSSSKIVGVAGSGKPAPVEVTPSAVPSIRKLRLG